MKKIGAASEENTGSRGDIFRKVDGLKNIYKVNQTEKRGRERRYRREEVG